MSVLRIQNLKTTLLVGCIGLLILILGCSSGAEGAQVTATEEKKVKSYKTENPQVKPAAKSEKEPQVKPVNQNKAPKGKPSNAGKVKVEDGLFYQQKGTPIVQNRAWTGIRKELGISQEDATFMIRSIQLYYRKCNQVKRSKDVVQKTQSLWKDLRTKIDNKIGTKKSATFFSKYMQNRAFKVKQ